MGLGKLFLVVLNAVFVVIILHGSLDGLLGQNGSVDLVGRQTVQSLDDRLI